MRYILDRTIGRHKSQSDVHIPATCRRTVTTVIRAQQLRDLADPPYGFCMLTNSAARTAIRPCRTVLLPLRSTGRMSWLHSAAAMVRSAALKANRNPHAARLRCSTVDRYRSLSAVRVVVRSASSVAAAPRIKMLGSDRLNRKPRRQRRFVRGGREEGGRPTWLSLIGVTLQSHRALGVIGACNEGS